MYNEKFRKIDQHKASVYSAIEAKKIFFQFFRAIYITEAFQVRVAF